MTQSKPVQKIAIPSKSILSKERTPQSKTFNIWEFLTTKSTEGSNCPIRGSLGFAKESPLIFAFSLIAIVILFSLIHPMHFFHG